MKTAVSSRESKRLSIYTGLLYLWRGGRFLVQCNCGIRHPNDSLPPLASASPRHLVTRTWRLLCDEGGFMIFRSFLRPVYCPFLRFFLFFFHSFCRIRWIPSQAHQSVLLNLSLICVSPEVVTSRNNRNQREKNADKTHYVALARQ